MHCLETIILRNAQFEGKVAAGRHKAGHGGRSLVLAYRDAAIRAILPLPRGTHGVACTAFHRGFMGEALMEETP